MKDEEFNKKLEVILESFEKIDQEIRQTSEKVKPKYYDSQILDNNYKTEKISIDNKYSQTNNYKKFKT